MAIELFLHSFLKGCNSSIELLLVLCQKLIGHICEFLRSLLCSFGDYCFANNQTILSSVALQQTVILGRVILPILFFFKTVLAILQPGFSM